VVASPFITVQVQNGTLGMLYLITLTANSSSTNNPTLAGYLAVTPGAP
jgi:hypothetical protein